MCRVIGFFFLSGHIYPCIVGLVDLCWWSMTQTKGGAKLLIFVYSSYNYYRTRSLYAQSEDICDLRATHSHLATYLPSAAYALPPLKYTTGKPGWMQGRRWPGNPPPSPSPFFYSSPSSLPTPVTDRYGIRPNLWERLAHYGGIRPVAVLTDGLVVVLPSTSMQCVGSGGDDAAGFPPTWVVTSTISHVLVPDRACPCTVAILVAAGAIR